MEIGWPTNVRHVAHVTFDRFNGFLGLPSEFEPEVPGKAPSASATVFGVSTESMQLSYDSRGNCVPVILLLMQSHLYDQGGLQAEGIFRITAETSEEKHVREQLNKGVIPEGIDVHCLAGLIKTWFRELPTGVLDPLSPEQVMQCETEEDFVRLVRLLPQTEASLLNWVINLMADVVQHEHLNKMNSRNISLVFAPNMSQMADPLNALMYSVQVMNLLKTLIEKTIREGENTSSRRGRSDDSELQSSYLSCEEDSKEEEQDVDNEEEEEEDAKQAFSVEEEEDDEEAYEEIFSEDEDDEDANEEEDEEENTNRQALIGEVPSKENVINSRSGTEITDEEAYESERIVSAENTIVDGDQSSGAVYDPTVGNRSGKGKSEIEQSRDSGVKNVLEKSHLQPPELPVPAISNLICTRSKAEQTEARQDAQ